MKGFKYIALGTLLMTLPSCGHDWLDVEPSTSIQTESSINVLNDIEFSLNGIYSIMQNSNAYSGRLVYYADATGDDMQAVSSTKRTGNYYRFNWTKDSGPSSHWSYLYKIINGCNNILTKIDDIEVREKEEARKNDLLGQAYAIRGMAYFDLARIFGYPYKKDGGASLGASIVLEPQDRTYKPKRATVAETYTQVINDLTKAGTLLSSKFNKGKINRWAAMTILSRVYLYKGNDALALQTATEAIQGAEGSGYALWTTEEYPTAWGNDISASNPGEVLFEIVNEVTDSPGRESLGYLHSKDGYDDICITTSFYKMISEDANDVRLKLLISDKKRYIYVFKYQPQEGENIRDANIPLVRLSEAYLNAAEAAFKTNDAEKAAVYLNAIVQRANPEKSVDAATLTLDRIMKERRLELVAEGHRMYDAVRDGGKVHRQDVNTGGQQTKTRHNTSYMEYDWNFAKIVLPIPAHEIETNPNMEQNKGYLQ